MASLIQHPPKHFAVQFVARDGRRPMIRLGRIPEKTAVLFRTHVEHLVNAQILSQPVPPKTAEWLADMDDARHAKLVKAGLVGPRDAVSVTALAAFLDDYIKRRVDIKPATRETFKQCRDKLVGHFGGTRDIRAITRGDIADWHRRLKVKVSAATLALHVKKSRQMFEDAVDRGLIPANPVAKLKAGSMANEERMVFVARETIDAVIDACPDAEWRGIFALARYGGVRVPSETNALRWADVDLANAKMVVRASKTEHHRGHGTRTVPIFPELMPYLRDLFDLAPEGAVHVIQKHRGENLRTTAEKIIVRAGQTVWEKLFVNLRSSRETELADQFPIHVVCKWIGNSQAVARKHYLQVTTDHFSQAVKGVAKGAAEGTGNDRKEPEPVAQNPLISSGFEESQRSRQEANKGRKRQRTGGYRWQTLHGALHRLRNASSSHYLRARRDIKSPRRGKAGGK